MKLVGLNIADKSADPLVGGDMHIVATVQQFLSQGERWKNMPTGSTGNE